MLKMVMIATVVALAPCVANAKHVYHDGGRHHHSYKKHSTHAYVKKNKRYKKYASRKRGKRLDANGNYAKGKMPPWNMVRVRTVQGFQLTVHPAHAHKFLRFFEILEQNHIEVPKQLVGCYSTRGHVRGSNHYNGIACDIQWRWNGTIPIMYTKQADAWIKQAGLFNGCDFGDCGHIEAIKGTFNGRKLPNLYAAMEKFKADQSTANYQP